MAHLTADFLLRALRIVLIDVLLAGDNAVVIAMAVKSLPASQRRTGLISGAGLAIVLRIALTFFATRLLELPFFKLVGGLLIFWIAIKLLSDSNEDIEKEYSAGSLRQAIWLILVADVTMSLDNIVAVAALSGDNLALLIVGLALSISFVMFMSGILSRLMDRYPVVLWLGAAILGQVSGEMIAGDRWVLDFLERIPLSPEMLIRICEAALASLVLLAGAIIKRNRRKKSDGVRV
jgi:YjbE family integral membrane protein